MEFPSRQRWEKDTRYYEVALRRDLFNVPCLVLTWGAKGTARAQQRTYPFDHEQEAMIAADAAIIRRKKRGYHQVAL
jgi:predicted DNA-binding WGR domain protein